MTNLPCVRRPLWLRRTLHATIMTTHIKSLTKNSISLMSAYGEVWKKKSHLLMCPMCACVHACLCNGVWVWQAVISPLTGRKVGVSLRCPLSSPVEGAALGGSPCTENLHQSGRCPPGPAEDGEKERGDFIKSRQGQKPTSVVTV